MKTFIVTVLILYCIIFLINRLYLQRKKITREAESELTKINGVVSNKYILESKMLTCSARGTNTISQTIFLDMILVEDTNNNAYHIQVDEVHYHNKENIENLFQVGDKVEIIAAKYKDWQNLVLKEGKIIKG